MVRIRLKWLISFVITLIFSHAAISGEYFDPSLLQAIDGKAVLGDTSSLSLGYQPAGTYRVHINVNDNPVLFSSVRFDLNSDKALVACLSFKLYQKLGIDMSKVNSNSEDNELRRTCKPIDEQVPGSKANFNFSKLQLDISIPQTVLRDESIQGVPVDEWDNGVPVLLSTYQLSGQQYLNRGEGTDNSVYANLTNGFNVGAWRYRNNSTVSNSENWENITNYVETAIDSLKGELTIGDLSTPGDVFDSVLIRGIQVTSDDDMLPDQLNGFAPIIRGIAKSNARVTVRENGYIIYQRAVPPGPFAITDLSSVSDGGKLEVTITETDGSESKSTLAYSSVQQLLREGQLKYNFAVGHYLSNSSSSDNKPEITQISLSRGLPLNTTLYGGSQCNDNFKAFSLGLGVDLQSIGGVALDVTRSLARRAENSAEGKMVRLSYRNEIPVTETQIQLDNRYYSGDYVSLNDWAAAGNSFEDDRTRKDYNLSINQSINDSNSFYTTLSRTANSDRSVSRMWQLGWSSSIKSISYSLAWSMSRNEGDPEWDKQLSLTVSVPLGDTFPSTQPEVNLTSTSGLKSDLSNQLAVSGKVGASQETTWNTQVSYTTQRDQENTESASTGLDYQGNYGDMNVTYNAERNQYLSWNASGSVVGHRHGMTIGRSSTGSTGLVYIPGAKNVPLENSQGVITDDQGYTLITDLRPYHRNTINIDTHKADKELDFTSTSAQLVPTKDAVVLAEFSAISGRKAVITVNYNGDVLPFGAIARIEGMDNLYYVGNRGQVYLNSVPDEGKLNFSWDEKESCSVPFKMPLKKQTKLPVTLLTLTCH